MTLGSALRSLPATQDDFEAWCLAPEGPDLGHFEFLYGCVVAEPPASWPHGLVSGSIGRQLASFVADRRIGLFFDASQGFALPSGDTVEPDAAVILPETWDAAPAPTAGRFLRIVPDLVVEVLSPRTARRDRGPKRHIYERNGVREYWLLDPRRREITVLVRGSRERFERVCTAAGDSLAHSTLLPEFATRPTAVFPARS